MSWLETRSKAGAIVNKRELAEIFDLSEETLTTWQTEGMPILERGGPGVPGKYDTAECIRWACLRELSKRGAQTAFDRLNEIRARREEINLRRDLGEVVLKSDVRPAFQRFVNDLDALLLGLPDKYAEVMELTQGVDGKHQLLVDIIGEIRDQASDYERCAGTAGGGNTAAETAA